MPAGKAVDLTTRLFAGAKESSVLKTYEDEGITNFSLAIDWGWFRWFLEKPILWLLKELFKLVGNFGIAIMLLTVIVRGLMFPVAQKQFASMAGDARGAAEDEGAAGTLQGRQAEAAAGDGCALQGRRGEPAGGLPADAAADPDVLRALQGADAGDRHAPPALRVVDQGPFGARSAAHPEPVRRCSISPCRASLRSGRWRVLLGITMFLQFKLNPAQMDPVQQQMFMFMPWILMFVMAPFAAGAAALLVHFERADHRPAGLSLQPPPAVEGADRQGQKTDLERAKARDKK